MPRVLADEIAPIALIVAQYCLKITIFGRLANILPMPVNMEVTVR